MPLHGEFRGSFDLVLWQLKSSGRQQQLCSIFGLVPTSVCVWVDYVLDVLYRTLRRSDNEDFRCAWPTVEELDESYALLQTNREYGHLLKGVFAVVDGGQFPCPDNVNDEIQNAYYEGYTCSAEVTDLLVYNFKGKIIHAEITNPGSCHHGSLAQKSGLVFPKLSNRTAPPGKAVLGDSNFSTKKVNGKIARSHESN